MEKKLAAPNGKRFFKKALPPALQPEPLESLISPEELLDQCEGGLDVALADLGVVLEWTKGLTPMERDVLLTSFHHIGGLALACGGLDRLDIALDSLQSLRTRLNGGEEKRLATRKSS